MLFAFGLAAYAQHPDVQSKFFPDPNYGMPLPITTGNPEINYFTRYKTCIKFIEDLHAKYPNIMKVSSIGKTQRGREEPAILLENQHIPPGGKRIRFTIISGIHGNEPIASEAVLYLVYKLLEDTSCARLLDGLSLQVIPLVNADGRESDSRVSPNGTDLNRDLTILNAKESRNLKTAINAFDPQVVIDFHEFAPDRKAFRGMNDCFTVGYDALFLYTGNLNVDPGIRRMISEDFVAPTKAWLEQHQRKVADYSTTRTQGPEIWLNVGGTASRSSATNYALQNRISLLMEIRGLSEKNKSIKRRMETIFLAATSYLKIAQAEAGQIRATLDSADKSCLHGSYPMVVTSKPDTRVVPFLFVDECKGEYKTIEFNALYNIIQHPVLTRPRPGGYIMFPCPQKAREVLKVSGVQMQELKEPVAMTVVAYERENSGSYRTRHYQLTIPAGAVVINAHQRMGNVIADLLEPEGSNSLAENKIISRDPMTKLLPLYRITPEQLSELQNKSAHEE